MLVSFDVRRATHASNYMHQQRHEARADRAEEDVSDALCGEVQKEMLKFSRTC